MSVQALAWALERAPIPSKDLVGVVIGLANHADDRGRGSYPSADTLAWYARKSERQVRRDLTVLEGVGLIRRGDQRMVLHLDPDRRPVVWDLDLTLCREERPPRAARGRPRKRGVVGDTPFVARGVTGGENGVSPVAKRGVTHVRGTVHEPSIEPGSAREAAGVTPTTVPDTPQDLPASTCPAHRLTPATGPCGPCGDHRRARADAELELATAQASRETTRRRHLAEARRLELAAIAACHLCDDDGRAIDVPLARCEHDAAVNARRVAHRQSLRLVVSRTEHHNAQEA